MFKDKKINIRLTEKEKSIIESKAKKLNMTLTKFIVSSCLKDKIVIVNGLDKVDSELRRIGNNINQLTRLANEKIITVIDLKELLQEGPKNNIHVVIWTGDVKKAQMLQLNKSLFKERICMEMSTEESKLVNGEDLKPMPTGFKAVLIGQNAIRFRVYDLPDGKWMNSLFNRLNNI